MINKQTSALTLQFISLRDQGLSPEEICESYTHIDGLTPEAVALAIRSATTEKRISADELIDKYRIGAIHYLGGLLDNPEANDMAKVKAAGILIDRKGCLPLVEADDVAAMFNRMKELREANNLKIVETPTTEQKVA